MTSTQSELASARLALRAAEKSSHQAKRPTVAPNDSAMATVSSVEPVSTTTISSTHPCKDARHPGRFFASSLTIKHADTVGTRGVSHPSTMAASDSAIEAAEPRRRQARRRSIASGCSGSSRSTWAKARSA
ncbi:hypothetical protein D3C72_952670 [compost metagenome]